MSSFKINFQPATSPVPQGYVADTGQAYSDAAGFGWVTEASLADGQPGTIPDPIAPHAGAMADRMTPGVDPRLTSYAHFAVPGAPAASPQRWAWEHTLANGWYAVTAAVGDTGGADDSVNVLNVEGQAFMAPWTPTASFKTNLVTGVVEITDGRLTLDSIGGTNTEIQYIEVKALPDITPDDGRPAVANYSALSNGVATTAGQPAQALDRATNIDPAAALAVDVTIVRSGAGVDDASFNPQTVRLYETLSGRAVAGQVNTTGGGDAIVLTPGAPLKENTSYTLRIDGVTDVSGVEFLPYSATFTTGANQASGPRTVAFSAAPQQVSASGFSSLVVAPDGMHLYAASLGGTIFRWDIDQATGALNNEQSFTDPSLAGRPLVGIVFDPASPDTLWVSSNGPGFSDASDFSGKVSKVTIAAGGAFEATVQDYVVGLPRSVRDHMSNSLSFRIDPGTGEHMLYLVQGGNTAMGAADNAWGNRPERLLGAAVLEIDPTRDVSAGPIDVQTQHPDAVLPAGAGAQPGWYDPFAPDAPVKLYATGIRNAYDLVWHSNGSLYVPSNGSAAGGNTPDDPGTAVSEALSGVSTQNDLLYKVVEGRYYGHPNPVRGEYVLNGGNPTAGTDPAQVSEYPVGVAPPVSYGGFAHDFSRNRSPNGVIEYKSGVLGDALKGSLLVAEYSAGNDILWLKLDANGNVVGSDVLKDASGTPLTLNDPLDLVEHAPSGRIYVATLGNGGITLLTPEPDAPTPAPRPIYEAEAAQLSGAVSASNWIGFTGSGFADFLNPTGDSVTWTVHVAQAGTYDLGWRYALATASGPDGRPLALSVNGEAANATLAFLPTGGAFTDWGTQTAAVALRAGANTVTLTTTGKSGANIDHLAVPDAPKTTHQPIYEAEAARLNGAVSASNWTGFTGSGFADFLNPTGESITWTVRVAEAGTYDLGWRYALAAASGPDGRPLALSVNGEAATGLLPFLPTGDAFTDWGTLTQAVALRAGANTVTLSAAGRSGPNIDHLAVADAPLLTDPDLKLVNLDGVPYPDRLVFSHIDDPGGRSFKNTAAVRIQNTGSDDLDLSGLELRGPFAFVDPRDGDPVSIRPGGSLDVEVRFDRAKYDPVSEPDIFTGQLRIAADGAVKTVELAGFWQSVGEGGQEPTVNEVWQTFGYSTRVSLADLDRRDIYEKANPQEVLSPYWKLADGAAAVTVTQIAAFHGLGADGTEIHAPGDKGLMKGLFGHPATWSQSLLPLSGAGKGAAATFDAGFVPDAWAGDDVFGFRVGGLSSDPRLNPTGAGTVPPGTQRGHFLRFFEARDEDGALIPNTYLAIHDYVGLNYDYNDNMYVISGIAPVPELGIA